MDDDFLWFKNHYAEFQKKYGNMFIVIKNKQVLGAYRSYAMAVRETAKTATIGTFIVQECSTIHEAYLCSIASMNFA